MYIYEYLYVYKTLYIYITIYKENYIYIYIWSYISHSIIINSPCSRSFLNGNGRFQRRLKPRDFSTKEEQDVLMGPVPRRFGEGVVPNMCNIHPSMCTILLC